MLGLLFIGAYTAYHTLNSMDKKAKWDRIVADFDVDRDYADVLKICGDMSLDDLKNAHEYTINDAIYQCRKNLKTIPYIDEKDLSDFEKKIWEVKALDYMEKRQKAFEYGKNEMVSLKRKYVNSPCERTTYNYFIGSFSHDDKETLYILMTETYFGEIVYNPKYWDWVEKNMPKDGYYNKNILKSAPDPCGYTDKYQVWVVDTPDKLCTDRIFHASMSYAKNKKMSARESKYRRKAGMSWKE